MAARTTPDFVNVGRSGVEKTDESGDGGTSKKSVTISNLACTNLASVDGVGGYFSLNVE